MSCVSWIAIRHALTAFGAVSIISKFSFSVVGGSMY